MSAQARESLKARYEKGPREQRGPNYQRIKEPDVNRRFGIEIVDYMYQKIKIYSKDVRAFNAIYFQVQL
jgi:hypothetical protein